MSPLHHSSITNSSLRPAVGLGVATAIALAIGVATGFIGGNDTSSNKPADTTRASENTNKTDMPAPTPNETTKMTAETTEEDDAPQWEPSGEYSYELTTPSGVRVAIYQPGYMGIGAEETRILETLSTSDRPAIALDALQDCSILLPYCRADISISTPTVSSAGLSYFVAASGLASVDSVSLWYRIIRPSDSPGSFIAFQVPLASLGEAAGVITPYEIIAPKAQSTDWPAERQRALDWAETPTPEVMTLVQTANKAAGYDNDMPPLPQLHTTLDV